MTRRQRLKRDPSNQPRSKLIAWANKNSGKVEAILLPGIVKPTPRIIWRAGHEPAKRSGPDRVRWLSPENYQRKLGRKDDSDAG